MMIPTSGIMVTIPMVTMIPTIPMILEISTISMILHLIHPRMKIHPNTVSTMMMTMMMMRRNSINYRLSMTKSNQNTKTRDMMRNSLDYHGMRGNQNMRRSSLTTEWILHSIFKGLYLLLLFVPKFDQLIICFLGSI